MSHCLGDSDVAYRELQRDFFFFFFWFFFFFVSAKTLKDLGDHQNSH
jgi:Trk-type K+ transport system membrane component